MSLVAQEVALQVVADIGPLIDRIARRDRSLAQQLRRSASSVALKVAVAWGYIPLAQQQIVDRELDRLLALLWGLLHRRR